MRQEKEKGTKNLAKGWWARFLERLAKANQDVGRDCKA